MTKAQGKAIVQREQLQIDGKRNLCGGIDW